MTNGETMTILRRLIKSNKEMEAKLRSDRLEMAELLEKISEDDFKEKGYHDDGLWLFSGGA